LAAAKLAANKGELHCRQFATRSGANLAVATALANRVRWRNLRDLP